MNKEQLKQQAAKAALDYIKAGEIIGVGTGSTVNYFIAALAKIRTKIEGAVATSVMTEKSLKRGTPVGSVKKARPYYSKPSPMLRRRKF